MRATYLQLDLQQGREVDERHVHALFLALKIDDIIKIPIQAVIEIDAFVGDVDRKMRENVFFFVDGRAVLRVLWCSDVRQPLSLLAIEQPGSGV